MSGKHNARLGQWSTALLLAAILAWGVTPFRSALAETPAAKPAADKIPAEKATAKVDLNTATEKELETLEGVGPATAKKIVAGRPYAKIEDLKNAGLSDKAIAKL